MTRAAVLLPDPECTPGSVTTEISPADTSSVCLETPADDVSDDVSNAILGAYGIGSDDRSDYVVDYLIPRSLGGANDYTNLWPIPLNDPSYDKKVAAVSAIEEAVCGGRAGIQAAQYALADDWSTSLTMLKLQG